MGSLISRVWTLFSPNRDYKIVVVGLNNAGKTSVLYALQLGKFVPTQPTLGGNVEEIHYKNLKFMVWDLGGQALLREAWSLYYTKTDAVILVVDSVDPERLHIVKDELMKMLAHPDLAKAAILIFANKQDLQGALPPEKIAEALELTMITRHQWRIQPCSALTQQGLSDGMSWIASQVQQPT